ncbi:MAG TPA: M20 family metallopeptidase [Patescibacteria group bacterium]|nr:M20 family metallopeptidase [Patescibacteria group bacterium]
MDRIYEYLSGQQEEMLQCLKTLVEMESPSDRKELCDPLVEHVAALFVRMTGGTCHTFRDETYGNRIRCEWGQGEEQILILAHCDTVFAQGTLQKNPFRIDAGKAYGPGVFDMKGGLVQTLYALKTLETLRVKPDKRVVLLVTTDEENGSSSSRQLIEEEARKSQCVLVPECSAAPHGSVKTMRKGVGRFRVTVTGRAAHSGVDFAKGISAVEELARQIIYLQGLTDLAAGTTVNVGVISGGSGINTVPAEAWADVDLRVNSLAAAETVVPKILELQPVLAGTRIVVNGGLNRPPFERSDGVEQLYLLAKSLADHYLGFELGETSTGGGSDGNFTAQIVPTLDGFGAVGDGAHTNGEYIVVDELPRRAALMALFLARFAG